MISTYGSTPVPSTLKPNYLHPKPSCSPTWVQCTNSNYTCHILRIASTTPLMLYQQISREILEISIYYKHVWTFIIFVSCINHPSKKPFLGHSNFSSSPTSRHSRDSLSVSGALKQLLQWVVPSGDQQPAKEEWSLGEVKWPSWSCPMTYDIALSFGCYRLGPSFQGKE